MASASAEVEFEGTFVYHNGGHIESMHVVQRMLADGEEQRLYALNGKAHVVVRKAGRVTVLLPDGSVIAYEDYFRSPPFPLSFSRDAQQLRRHYDLSLLERDRVAGRTSRAVQLQPKDPYRYGYMLWMDEETGVLLRSEVIDEKQRPLEQLLFTGIHFGTARACNAFDWSMVEIPKKVEGGHRQPIKTEVISPWKLSKLPPGFSVISHFKQAPMGDMAAMEHLVLSDGLATVSVYIEERDGDKEAIAGESRIGAVNAYGAIVANHQIIVVGEVPAPAVRLIAGSLRYEDPGQ
jgi:sigma-E factor negative regulatory protein RseB